MVNWLNERIILCEDLMIEIVVIEWQPIEWMLVLAYDWMVSELSLDLMMECVCDRFGW